MPRQTFFGKEIRRDIRETQVTQIYQILVQEIASGRWEIDSRFPSVTQLVGESGLSRGSIQKVLARLEQDGLIATESRRGTFVTALHPAADPPPAADRIALAKVAEVAATPSHHTADVAYRINTPTPSPIPEPEPGDPVSATPPDNLTRSESDPLPLFADPFAASGAGFLPGGETTGRVGVALIKHDPKTQSSPRENNEPLLQELLDTLAEFGYRSSVSYLEPSPDWEVLAGDGGPFDDAVDGVIAIGSGGFVDFTSPPPGRCPVVFIAGAEAGSIPGITCDHTLGSYRATKDLTSLGHKRIIACPDTGFHREETDAFLKGHREAMARVGLPVDEEAISQASTLQNGDFSSLRQFIHQFRDATAVLCGDPRRATEIIALCDAVGIQVPADLSVATSGRSPMRGDASGETMTGFDFPPEKLAQAALSLLDEILHTGSSRFSQLRVPPEIVAGNSTASPRSR